jgi:hypothetical protein
MDLLEFENLRESLESINPAIGRFAEAVRAKGWLTVHALSQNADVQMGCAILQWAETRRLEIVAAVAFVLGICYQEASLKSLDIAEPRASTGRAFISSSPLAALPFKSINKAQF